MLRTFVIAALAAVAGCGGSSAPAPVTGVAWTANGVAMASDEGRVSWSSDAGRDTLELRVSTGSVALGIALVAPSPLGPATFRCGQVVTDKEVFVMYAVGAARPLDLELCVVVLTQVGRTPDVPVVGTFEAIFLEPSGGGTTTLTNGTFRLPLSM